MTIIDSFKRVSCYSGSQAGLSYVTHKIGCYAAAAAAKKSCKIVTEIAKNGIQSGNAFFPSRNCRRAR